MSGGSQGLELFTDEETKAIKNKVGKALAGYVCAFFKESAGEMATNAGNLLSAFEDMCVITANKTVASLSQPKPSILNCSFCNKHKDEVQKLITGPGVGICDECIYLCDDILAEDGIVPANTAPI